MKGRETEWGKRDASVSVMRKERCDGVIMKNKSDCIADNDSMQRKGA